MLIDELALVAVVLVLLFKHVWDGIEGNLPGTCKPDASCCDGDMLPELLVLVVVVVAEGPKISELFDTMPQFDMSCKEDFLTLGVLKGCEDEVDDAETGTDSGKGTWACGLVAWSLLAFLA